MTPHAIGTPEKLRDPKYTPPLSCAIPQGEQSVLALSVSNVTPAIIVAGAAGFGLGSYAPEFPASLNLILPKELAEEATDEVLGGMSGHGKGSLPH